PPPLPSLLSYVDHYLTRDTSTHNQPPSTQTTCGWCVLEPNGCPEGSTFLPLVPCGCWVHYRCFIWHTSLDIPERGRCPLCNTQLFEWEGITTLTLTTRTALPMPNRPFATATSYIDPRTKPLIDSSAAEYEADCCTISSLIADNFYRHLNFESPFEDQSPDLTKCYYDVLLAIAGVGLPRSEWLKWKTQCGFYLFGMLVACKMRRYLLEKQPGIVRTIAWWRFVEG
ncbi:hypothetical protein CC80DRAFT_367296, partial [Byssothecium circinans]